MGECANRPSEHSTVISSVVNFKTGWRTAARWPSGIDQCCCSSTRCTVHISSNSLPGGCIFCSSFIPACLVLHNMGHVYISPTWVCWFNLIPQVFHIFVRTLQSAGVLAVPLSAQPFIRMGLDAISEGLFQALVFPVSTIWVAIWTCVECPSVCHSQSLIPRH